MQPFVTHTGRAVPLRRTNVDTDQIIPASYLKRVSREGFGDGLFAAWREDPSFVLNQPRYAGTTILVTRPGDGVFGTPGEERPGATRESRPRGMQFFVTVALLAGGGLLGDLQLGELLREAGVGPACADLLERGEVRVELLLRLVEHHVEHHHPCGTAPGLHQRFHLRVVDPLHLVAIEEVGHLGIVAEKAEAVAIEREPVGLGPPVMDGDAAWILR